MFAYRTIRFDYELPYLVYRDKYKSLPLLYKATLGTVIYKVISPVSFMPLWQGCVIFPDVTSKLSTTEG
jgi:hypothetical protein